MRTRLPGLQRANQSVPRPTMSNSSANSGPPRALAQAVIGERAAQERVVGLADVGHHELANLRCPHLIGQLQPEDVRIPVQPRALR